MKIDITQKLITTANQFHLAILRVGAIITIAGLLSGIPEAVTKVWSSVIFLFMRKNKR